MSISEGRLREKMREEGEMMVIFKRRLLKFELLGKRGKKEGTRGLWML